MSASLNKSMEVHKLDLFLTSLQIKFSLSFFFFPLAVWFYVMYLMSLNCNFFQVKVRMGLKGLIHITFLVEWTSTVFPSKHLTRSKLKKVGLILVSLVMIRHGGVDHSA